MPSATYFTRNTVRRLGSSVRTSIIAVFVATAAGLATPELADATAQGSPVLSSGVLASSAPVPAALASNPVPLTGASAVALGVSAVADGKPPVATEPSRGLKSPATCVPENGGGAAASLTSAGLDVETVALAGADSGSEIEGDWSAAGDWGEAGFRRKMPLSPNDTGDAGAPDRARLAFSAGPTVTMIRFPSAFIV